LRTIALADKRVIADAVLDAVIEQRRTEHSRNLSLQTSQEHQS
jgi:hypothetical protein